ncbi:ATP-dependent RNA helicase [Umbelopsis sp. WA50703]
MTTFNTESREQKDRRDSSAFQWPSPSQVALSYSDISIKDILDTYQHDVELLKVILLAKAEEDKKRTAEEVCKAEEAKLKAKTIELELMKAAKASRHRDTNVHQSADPAMAGPRHNVTSIAEDQHSASPMSLMSDRFVPCSTASPNAFTYSEQFGSLFSSIPSTPPEHFSQVLSKKDTENHMELLSETSIYKKHSLDDPIEFEQTYPYLSPHGDPNYQSRGSHKRSRSLAHFTRSSAGNSSDRDQGNVAHEQVMEALRAKIQRTRNQSGPSTIRNQPPLRHRRSHSAVINRQKTEGSSQSPSSDSLSLAGDFSPQQEPSMRMDRMDVDASREPMPINSLSPLPEDDKAITEMLRIASSDDKCIDSVHQTGASS